MAVRLPSEDSNWQLGIRVLSSVVRAVKDINLRFIGLQMGFQAKRLDDKLQIEG